MGSTLGIEEARRAWQLLRRPVSIATVDVDAGDGPETSMRDAGPSACVVTTIDGTAGEAWDDLLERSGVLHVDGVAHRTNGGRCVSSRFVVGIGDDDGSKLLWHHSLERFGARQLNDRFRSRFSREMDGAEWAAWFAVKVASEAMLRVGSDPRALEAYLASDRTTFDGHKGKPLGFGPDHRLIQPLYAVRRGTDGGVEEVAFSNRATAACVAGPATS